MWIYLLLNYFFWFFHTTLVLFNLFGWCFKRTRKWNLYTLLATAFSWFFLGIWYGWGYCLCTDWHWKVRSQLGYQDNSSTYIHLMLWKITGVNFPVALVEWTTLGGFIISLIISVSLNVRDYRGQLRSQAAH